MSPAQAIEGFDFGDSSPSLLRSLRGVSMRPLSTYGFFDLGRITGGLGMQHLLLPDTVMSNLLNFQFIAAALKAKQFNEEVLRPRKLETGALTALHDTLMKYADLEHYPIGQPLGDHAAHIHRAFHGAQRALADALPKLHAYILTKKRGYDLDILIESPEDLLSANSQRLLSSYLLDNWREAGRCLAFEVPTAAGFHLLRVTEAVIRKYHKAITGKEFPDEAGGVGVAAYLRSIRGKASENVVAALSQLRAVHRNPTMHPGPLMDADDANSLVGLCVSVIDTIASDIAKRRTKAEK